MKWLRTRKGGKERNVAVATKITRGKVQRGPPMRAVLFNVGDFNLFLVDNSGLEQILCKTKRMFSNLFRRLQVM